MSTTTKSTTTMSAAESAALAALNLALEPLTALFGGNAVLDILLNPGLVPDDVVQVQFAAITKPEEVDGAQPKLLGLLSAGQKALYASISQAGNLLYAATEAFEVFGREHQKRHHHSAVDELDSAKGADESEKEAGDQKSKDEGCAAVDAAHATLRRFAETLSRRRDTFWALIKDQYPDAGDMGITFEGTVVELAPKFDSDLASLLASGLIKSLMSVGGLGGLVEVKIDSKGGLESPFGSLFDSLGGLLRRRRDPAGRN